MAVPPFVSKMANSAALCSAALELHFPPALHRLGEGNFVRVFQIATHGHAMRDACDQYPHGLEQPGDVGSRGFPFNIRVGGQDDLLDRMILKARQQLPDARISSGPMPSMGERVPCSTW